MSSLRLGRPSDDDLARVLVESSSAALTYSHVGSTLPAGPGGTRLRVHRRVLGTGGSTYASAVAALRGWAPQRATGARVLPEDAPLVTGTTVVVALPVGPVTALAANRVVGVIEERRRFGFAYGSLPVHPFSGEESFVVEHLDSDEVRATISVESRPRALLARLGAPVVPLVQREIIRRYLAAIGPRGDGR
jgi:uncharacterized protein (UPF0548 family)